jgi:hypothetical protein
MSTFKIGQPVACINDRANLSTCGTKRTPLVKEGEIYVIESIEYEDGTWLGFEEVYGFLFEAYDFRPLCEDPFIEEVLNQIKPVEA